MVNTHCNPHISSISIQDARESWEEARRLDEPVFVEKIRARTKLRAANSMGHCM